MWRTFNEGFTENGEGKVLMRDLYTYMYTCMNLPNVRKF